MKPLELPVINRSLIIVLMKQPYVDWANNLPDQSESELNEPLTLEDVNQDPGAFLIPEIFDNEELDAYLENSWRLIFETQLSDWTSNQKVWPKDLSYVVFNQWFGITLNSMVTDLWSKQELLYVD